MVWLLGPPVHAKLEDGSLHNILPGELTFTAGIRSAEKARVCAERAPRRPGAKDGGSWKRRPELSSLGGGSTDQKETHLTSEIPEHTPGLVVEFLTVCVGGHWDLRVARAWTEWASAFLPSGFSAPLGWRVRDLPPPPLQAPPRSGGWSGS